MICSNRLIRSLSLVLALSIAHASASAQTQACAGSITGDVSVVSISAGGVQNLTLSVLPSQLPNFWYLTGSMSGTLPGSPFLATAGLYLNFDRYTYAMTTGTSPLVRGGTPNAYGVIPNFDAQGIAHLQVVVPPMALPALIGRTVHHGFFTFDTINLEPSCGSNTVALLFVP